MSSWNMLNSGMFNEPVRQKTNTVLHSIINNSKATFQDRVIAAEPTKRNILSNVTQRLDHDDTVEHFVDPFDDYIIGIIS